MSLPLLTIRIRTESEQDMDWMVRPDQMNFRQSLEVISNVLQNKSLTAFDYDDEDGERITVRSDDELQTMLTSYFNSLKEEDLFRGLLPPLIVYPKVCKSPQHRNIHGLTINTRQLPVSFIRLMNVQKKNRASQNIKDILACGHIAEDDLTVIEIVGHGNTGKVNRALHKPSHKIMAVKVIQLDVTHETQSEIISELEILCQCHSPAIIGFYGAFFVENRISICTEFMDGGSLDKYGKVPVSVLGKITCLVVQGLQYLWSLKILHRDVKPSNILINSEGEVKLCDFGVSTQLVESIATTYVGTNAYMAPERLEAKEYGMPADVWSLGVSLFELATGEFPFAFARGQVGEVLKAIVEKPPPKLPEEQFPPQLVHYISKCMQTLPQDRLPAADLLVHAYTQMHCMDSCDIIANWVQQQKRSPLT
ncbi:specificity mitogen-activated kinase kinase 5-like [Argonauta hians]